MDEYTPDRYTQVTDSLCEIQAAFDGLIPREGAGANEFYCKYRSMLALYSKAASLITLLEEHNYKVPQAYYDWATAGAALLEKMQSTFALCEALVTKATKH